MSVENALTCIGSGVKNGSVPIKATFGGYLVGGQEQVGGDGGAIACNPNGVFSVQGRYQ